MKTIERFFNKIEIPENAKRDCWIWVGCKIKGYGAIRIKGRNIYAHRYMFNLVNGYLPEHNTYYSKSCVLHTCDNPNCVSPMHLYLGTHKDNTRDMLNRGRVNCRKGENHPCNKLVEEKILLIRKEWALGGISQKTLGKKYNIAQSTVSQIVTYKRWGHI